MAELNEKLVEAVTKLIKLTQEKKIIWLSAAPTEKLKGTSISYVETAFYAYHNKQHLRLYTRITKATPQSAFLSSVLSEKTRWQSKTILEIIDEKGNVIWTFPQISALPDLVTSVRYQLAGVDDFIEGLLKD